MTIITGPEWLEHRGSVGRPTTGEIMVTDLDGDAAAPGEQGEIWLRNTGDHATYRYVGAEARTMDGGWESLGDMGWFDADGYLYLGDRMQDMILSGGANIYPAEVEAAIQEHPAVRSVCVIGLPDEDRGNVVHAIVEADAATIDAAELLAFAGERLAGTSCRGRSSSSTCRCATRPARSAAPRCAPNGCEPPVASDTSRRSPDLPARRRSVVPARVR